MNITLRKASALQNSINDVLKQIELKTEISINEFQDAESEINRAALIAKSNLGRRDQLSSVLYEIRKAVSEANTRAGISSKLADVAHLDKQIQFYSNLTSKDERLTATVVAGKLDKIRNRKEDSRVSIYGRDETVDTGVFTANDIDGFRHYVAGAKKSKQKLQDEILELNVRVEITVSNESALILKNEGLI